MGEDTCPSRISWAVYIILIALDKLYFTWVTKLLDCRPPVLAVLAFFGREDITYRSPVPILDILKSNFWSGGWGERHHILTSSQAIPMCMFRSHCYSPRPRKPRLDDLQGPCGLVIYAQCRKSSPEKTSKWEVGRAEVRRFQASYEAPLHICAHSFSVQTLSVYVKTLQLIFIEHLLDVLGERYWQQSRLMLTTVGCDDCLLVVLTKRTGSSGGKEP